MTRYDLAAVCAIEQRAYDFPWNRGIFSDCLHAGYRCQVIESGHSVCGYAILTVAAGEAHLLNLCVDPDWRRHGLARRLLEQSLDQARHARADTIFLEVRPSNPAARELYRSAGFCELGVRPGYYPAAGDRREDAVMMARTL